MSSPMPAENRTLILVGRLMLIEAVTFAIASILHLGITETFIAAAIPEAIIAVVLGAAAIAVMRRGAGSWGLALAATLFALAGVIIGLSVIIGGDRKSTRLNSSHGYISYAVFCLKKKKKLRTQAQMHGDTGTWRDLPAPAPLQTAPLTSKVHTSAAGAPPRRPTAHTNSLSDVTTR